MHVRCAYEYLETMAADIREKGGGNEVSCRADDGTFDTTHRAC